MYQVVFLETAITDMQEIVSYIATVLHNPEAADKLANRLIEAPESIRESPYAHPVYIPIRPLTHEYRQLYINNYTMYYIIDEKAKTISIERVTYSKRKIADEL